MIEVLDERDQAILAERAAARSKLPGPLHGDFVRFPSGEVERFSHNWDWDVQTSPAWAGSFYLSDSGAASFSGSLNPAIPVDSLTLTGETMPGQFWFFHHGYVGPHRGVYGTIPCRVFETSAAYRGFVSRAFGDCAGRAKAA